MNNQNATLIMKSQCTVNIPAKYTVIISRAGFIMLSLILLLMPVFSIAAASNSSDKLFEFAEKNYPQYFKPSGTNSFAVENYLVRYYAETNTYLGTLGSDVFVYGDEFGGLLKVGRVNDFISIPVRIDAIKPAKASSGTEVTIIGEGFTEGQQIIFGELNIKPNSISEKEIRFIVPFDLNAKKELIPLQAGAKIIQIADSNQVVMQVVDLPDNPNSPGKVITDVTNNALLALSENLSNFKDILPQMLDKYKDQPSIQEFLSQLNIVAGQLETEGLSEFSNLEKIPSQTLDTLEKALLSNELSLISTSNRSLAFKKELMTESIDCSTASGDQWLECRRESFIANSESLSFLSKVFSACTAITAFVPGGQAITLLCAQGALMGLVTSTINDAVVANNYGIIKNIKLLATDEVPSENLILKLNNADNNEIFSPPSTKIIWGVSLGIVKDLDAAGVIRDFVTGLLDLVDLAPSIIPAKLIEVATNWIDQNNNKPTNNIIVSTAHLNHILTNDILSPDGNYLFIDQPPLVNYKPCIIGPDVEFPANGSDKWRPIVHDKGNIRNKTHVGDCIAKISPGYRLEKEISVQASMSFVVSRFPKITISKEDLISKIQYSQNAYFEHDSCLSGSCVEYFDLEKFVSPFRITLISDSPATYWIGSGADECKDGDRCTVQFDQTNNLPPNLTAHSYSGTWIAHVTDDESKCDEGINTYDLSANVAVNGSELNIYVRPVAWSGPLLTDPNTINFNVNFSEDEGTTSENGLVSFNKGTFTGKSNWSWSDGYDSCSGTSTFSGAKY